MKIKSHNKQQQQQKQEDQQGNRGKETQLSPVHLLFLFSEPAWERQSNFSSLISHNYPSLAYLCPPPCVSPLKHSLTHSLTRDETTKTSGQRNYILRSRSIKSVYLKRSERGRHRATVTEGSLRRESDAVRDILNQCFSNPWS